jgi:hypothetical protein
MTIDIFGPLIESCLVGGLTAILVAYAHAAAEIKNDEFTEFPKEDIKEIMEIEKNEEEISNINEEEKKLTEEEEKLKKEIEEEFKDEEKLDPLLLTASIFFLNEITILIAYVLITINSIVIYEVTINTSYWGYIVIYFAYFVFIIAIIYFLSLFDNINYILKSRKIDN